jgi:glutamate-1-semialdehyde 2,1-aminomutase
VTAIQTTLTEPSRGARLYQRASQSLVAGVSASARLHGTLGRPLYVERGEGGHVWDLDGRAYLDFVLSQGATFLGHDHPGVRAAVEEVLRRGVICGYETEHQTLLAETLCRLIPCAELVRLANTGGEATQTALRIARSATGRQVILKFEGHYHGLHDYATWNTRGAVRDELPTYPYVPPAVDSSGVPPQLAELVVVVPWNDPDAVTQAMAERGHEIAAIICEPVNYNAGCIPPKPGFLQTLRDLATRHGAVLIFDEVLTSFRMAPGGAQEHYGVTPDLSTTAKAIANGMPLAAVVGRADLMRELSPAGKALHSGTYTGHLIPVLAALATLAEVERPGFYDDLLGRTGHFYEGLNRLFVKHGLGAHVQGVGARFAVYWGAPGPVWSYQDALRCDETQARRFVGSCLERGVFLSLGARGLGHQGVAVAHTLADLDEALARIDGALAEMARS